MPTAPDKVLSAAWWLTVAIAVSLFRQNVAIRSRRLRAGLGASQASDNEQMTQAQLSLVQDKAGHWGLARRTTDGLIRVVPKPDEPGDYGNGLKDAVIRLNKMALEIVEQNDTETLRCNSFFQEQNQLIVEVRQDLDYFSMAANDAFAKVQHVENSISSTLELVKNTQDELTRHKHACDDEKKDLHYQLEVVKGDQGVMKKILDLTQCSDETLGKAFLLQCADTNTGRHFVRVQAKNPELRKQLGLLKHVKSRQIIEDQVITTDLRTDDEAAAESEVFLQISRRKLAFDPPPPAEYVYMGPNGESSRCSISNSATCPELREKFMNIAGSIEDAKEELEMMLGSVELTCAETMHQLQMEQRHYEFFHLEQEKKLAYSSAARSEAFHSNQLKQNELREIEARFDAETKKCTGMFQEFDSQHCALTKIRAQLLQMDNLEQHILDCQMASWEQGDCSRSCGGGKMVLKRKIQQFPGPGPEEFEAGHKCPISEAVVACNEQRCPVDCELTDWSAWGACSRLCDGGFQERSRQIKKRPIGAGEPCESDMDSQQCNVDLCHQDCQLSEWSDWSSTCSKQCGGGQQTRVKSLVAPAIGMGQCPQFYDPRRYDKKPCNTLACSYSSSMATCNAMVDVMILIDGSASMGTEGFDAAKAAAAKFARSMGGKAYVAALLFSGPDNFATLDQCQGLAAGSPTLDQCGIKWVKHLTADYTGVATGIEGLAHPQTTAFMSVALDACEHEMQQFGRLDAHSVLVIFTDGTPISKIKMTAAAERLNHKAQIVTALVGPEAEVHVSDFKQWVAEPWQDNLEIVNEWAAVSDNKTLNTLMTDFCSNMDFH